MEALFTRISTRYVYFWTTKKKYGVAFSNRLVYMAKKIRPIVTMTKVTMAKDIMKIREISDHVLAASSSASKANTIVKITSTPKIMSGK